MCVWKAETPNQHGKGLMRATDLGAGEGMLFIYEAPTSMGFWMKNTPMPLTIAFFDAQGAHMRSFDMQPCMSGSCRIYPAPSNYSYALEIPQGTAANYGIGPGSTLTIGNGCTATN